MNSFAEVVATVLARFGVRAVDILVEVGVSPGEWEELRWEKYHPAAHDILLRGEQLPRVDLVVTATPDPDGRERHLTPQTVEEMYPAITAPCRITEYYPGGERIKEVRQGTVTYGMPPYSDPSWLELRDLIQAAANEAGLGAGIHQLHVR